MNIKSLSCLNGPVLLTRVAKKALKLGGGGSRAGIPAIPGSPLSPFCPGIPGGPGSPFGP